MSKIIRTNERCYICDFSRDVDDDAEYPDALGDAKPSVYLDSLTNGPKAAAETEADKWYHKYQDVGHRYVFIDPRDGKPVCTQCAEEAIATVKEMEYIDRGFKPLTWEGESEETWNERGFSFVDHPDEQVGFDIEEHILGLHSLYDDDIDWENARRWANGNIGFPLPKKAKKFELTDKDREEIDEIRRKKGYLKSPETEDQAREARNKRLDDTWQPLSEKPGLAKTGTWPFKADSNGSVS